MSVKYKSKEQIRRDIVAPEVFSELNSKAECGVCNKLFDSIEELVNHVWNEHNRACNACKGTGKTYGSKCLACFGSGYFAQS